MRVSAIVLVSVIVGGICERDDFEQRANEGQRAVMAIRGEKIRRENWPVSRPTTPLISKVNVLLPM